MPRTSGKDSTNEAAEEAVSHTEESTQAQPARSARTHVIVINRKGNKKKRKYTRGLKDIQRLERGVTRASRRLSGAAESGFKSYNKNRNKSSRRRRDGAIRDALENWTRALGRAVRRGSDAPYDVARAFNSKRVSRQLRNVIRLVTPPLFR